MPHLRRSTCARGRPRRAERFGVSVVQRPEYGIGIVDRRLEYGWDSGALGHTGLAREGYRTAALCFQNPGIVVVVLANAEEHDVDTTAGNLWRAASN